MTDIRRRALTALALNRTPGFHFIGNFLGVQFAEILASRSRVVLDAGPHCEGADGQYPLSVVSLIADVALASVVRANLNPSQRLATVSLQLQLTGAPCIGPLEGVGVFEGFLQGVHGQQGLARATVQAGGQPVLFATGAFMVLAPPPGVTMHAVANADHARSHPLPLTALTREEVGLLARIDAAIADAGPALSFMECLLQHNPEPTLSGATCRVANGPHLGNRVGHMQGGLQVGLAITTANAALPARWRVSGLSACFVSPGEGRVLRAVSRIVHRGRQTAVVHTTITGKHRRLVLDVVSTHAWCGDA
jgi:acyl-coenzyme A thioesterase PaaI-like protein